MIKILSATQIREADAYTIQQEPISSIQLMERAAIAFVQQFLIDFPDKKQPKYIICGNGNNGGDGLAIARLLLGKGHIIEIFLISSKQYSNDYLYNLKRLQKQHKKQLHLIESADFIDKIPTNAIIIDAIFGTGLNKPIQTNSIYYKIIEYLNQQKFPTVISVDIPSGISADIKLPSIAVKANKTYTFQFPKISFLLPQTGAFVNEFKVLDIHLHAEFIQQVKTDYYFIEANDIIARLKHRSKFSHKGTYGHALIIAGSYGKMGAAILSSKAALRSGAGLVSAHIPACGYTIFQTAFPEAMCSVDKHEQHITTFPKENIYDAIAIGPGIGTHDETIKAFATFLKKQQCPIIIDADGLNILAHQKILLKSLPANSILTPHPKELERLVGKWKDDFERLKLQKEFSKKYKVIVVLKGANSSISSPDGVIYFNSSGHAGMATAGSGDVLTGVLVGMLSQGYPPIDTALVGVFLHGKAAEIALHSQSMESMIVSDIINNLGAAFKSLQ